MCFDGLKMGGWKVVKWWGDKAGCGGWRGDRCCNGCSNWWFVGWNQTKVT